MRRVTDGARTRDLLSATIRTHTFAGVHWRSEIRLLRRFSRIVRSLTFADVRPGCRQNCRQLWWLLNKGALAPTGRPTKGLRMQPAPSTAASRSRSPSTASTCCVVRDGRGRSPPSPSCAALAGPGPPVGLQPYHLCCRVDGGVWIGVRQALGGRPTSRASSRFSPRDDVGACPARSPGRSSGAGVRPCSARLGSSAASAPSTGPVLLASPPPYHDPGPTRVLRFSISSGLLS